MAGAVTFSAVVSPALAWSWAWASGALAHPQQAPWPLEQPQSAQFPGSGRPPDVPAAEAFHLENPARAVAVLGDTVEGTASVRISMSCPWLVQIEVQRRLQPLSISRSFWCSGTSVVRTPTRASISPKTLSEVVGKVASAIGEKGHRPCWQHYLDTAGGFAHPP